jgi:glutathione S-transferase
MTLTWPSPRARPCTGGRDPHQPEIIELAGLKEDYLLGPDFSVADAYLFVMLMWARKKAFPSPNPLLAYVERIKARPAVRLSLEEEKLA